MNIEDLKAHLYAVKEGWSPFYEKLIEETILHIEQLETLAETRRVLIKSYREKIERLEKLERNVIENPFLEYDGVVENSPCEEIRLVGEMRNILAKWFGIEPVDLDRYLTKKSEK